MDATVAVQTTTKYIGRVELSAEEMEVIINLLKKSLVSCTKFETGICNEVIGHLNTVCNQVKELEIQEANKVAQPKRIGNPLYYNGPVGMCSQPNVGVTNPMLG